MPHPASLPPLTDPAHPRALRQAEPHRGLRPSPLPPTLNVGCSFGWAWGEPWVSPGSGVRRSTGRGLGGSDGAERQGLAEQSAPRDYSTISHTERKPPLSHQSSQRASEMVRKGSGIDGESVPAGPCSAQLGPGMLIFLDSQNRTILTKDKCGIPIGKAGVHTKEEHQFSNLCFGSSGSIIKPLHKHLITCMAEDKNGTAHAGLECVERDGPEWNALACDTSQT